MRPHGRAAHGTIALALCVVALAAHPQMAGAQAADSIPLDTILAQPRFPSYMPISLSPDGQWVAFTLQFAGQAGASFDAGYSRTGVANQFVGCSVWITNVETGKFSE